MRATICFIGLLAASPAWAAPDLCPAVAKSLEASLRAFKPSPAAEPAFRRISIRNAVARQPAAGLNFGGPMDDKAARGFPFAANERAQLKQSTPHLARAGGERGLVLFDAEAGTAHCHTPFLFSLAQAAPVAIAIPGDADPYDLCAHGGLALGALGGQAFFVESEDDHGEIDRLKIFAQSGDGLAAPCTVSAHYRVDYVAAENFCAQPGLCGLGGKAAQWARAWREGGAQLRDPAFAPTRAPNLPEDDPAAFPTFGGVARSVPQAFRFNGEENFFTILGEPQADLLRIGAADAGPANMADWEAFTLVALYKSGQPVASFVIEKRRGAVAGVNASDR